MNVAHDNAMRIPAEIRRRLKSLRARIVQWNLVDRLGRLVLLVLALLLVDMGLDRWLGFDAAQRAILLIAMSASAIGYLIWKVLVPLAARPSDELLLEKIEQAHPEHREVLISGAELAQMGNVESLGMSSELAEATIQRSVELAKDLDIDALLDWNRFYRYAGRLAVGLVLLVALGVGITQVAFLKTWFHRNILLRNDPWPQSTYLEIVGANDGVLIVPRGANHRQLVRVTPDSKEQDVTVKLELDLPTGKVVHQMRPTGREQGREHEFVLHNVSTEFRFRASGGDDVTPWIQVQLVEPPAISSLKLTSILPPYAASGEIQLVGAGPHTVLDSSSLRIELTANKPLQQCVVTLGLQELAMQPVTENSDTRFQLLLPDGDGALLGGEYQIRLLDKTGLSGLRPAKFVIKTRPDAPPKGRAALLGISGLVVPRARIPMEFSVLDEFGLSRLAFDAKWKMPDEQNSEAEVQKLEQEIAEFASDATPVRQVDDVAVLQLETLRLVPGTSLVLSVAAWDNLPGKPNRANSNEFLLRVVTEQELRDDMLRRGIEQRRAFQQAYDAQMELAAELRAIAAMQPENETLDDLRNRQELALIDLNRDQQVIGTTIVDVATRFEEFLVEAQNNRLDEDEQALVSGRTIAERFDQGIIKPIRDIDSELIPVAIRHLDNCRRLLDQPADLNQAVEQAGQVHAVIMQEMKKILDAMSDSENFQEVINKLLEIKRGEQQIRSETERQTRPDDDIFDDDPGGIFDDDGRP